MIDCSSYCFSLTKTGLSALTLKRQLGVGYPIVWLTHHKLMQAMADREDRYVFDGEAQVDDASSFSSPPTRPCAPRTLNATSPGWKGADTPVSGSLRCKQPLPAMESEARAGSPR